MDVHVQSAMGLNSLAVSDWISKQIVTIFSKTCNNENYPILSSILSSDRPVQ